ncbi:hypothetical protein LEP1GSC133_4831 [Leptospira borgpetersenii serovar Pomona str. 200901868]|uniref:Uncharacterized protein n=1 Tax=Leptospira borgpetersenii serovar Pomona str. 200901868 TaxID=1192866 RepID=M6VVE6_LEPBO|nr:hypothetical protein LEP1GSC133_4831 [Leptospira borgpetersenii serovar Pomona str. 200901868]
MNRLKSAAGFRSFDLFCFNPQESLLFSCKLIYRAEMTR